ncbi:response regulator transcription factor [Streptomyces zingiberis]|uniref:Response regulator transcription factor n=1 Tax=Streptomyces zingiberis TaxID=2053010 RepID=A0ABX1BU70_9ACTN|nr:LuxR C-terminal-related transcriptional regulator [Streptomyces zingiberis]NJQ01274.1 response regulator transcription factor [Streptomyces zingiberis]
MSTAETETLNPRAGLATEWEPAPFHDEGWEVAMARVRLLSERELDVLQLLGRGASNRTIATQLGITERTAKAHVAQILTKLDVESRLQAGITGFAWRNFARGTAARGAGRLP